MRIGINSRYLLEMIAAFGLEVAEAAISLPTLYRGASFCDSYSLERTTRLLSRQQWIELREAKEKGKWAVSLTEDGRSAIAAELDPEACWNETWDRRWRLLSFDLPQHSTASRQSLRKWLKKRRFGRLQGSVWISPREIGNWTAELAKLSVGPDEVLHMFGDLGPSADPKSYVSKAWNFKAINDRYKAYLAHLSAFSCENASASGFPDWFQQDLSIWKRAFDGDPLLPKALWTESFAAQYLGPQALLARRKAYASWRVILGQPPNSPH